MEFDSCDSATSTQALEYIPDVNPALDEITRILKPGGAFVITRRDGNSPALYTEAVMANFALTQGISREEVSDWKSQLKETEAQGRFGFASFPVITSAYLG